MNGIYEMMPRQILPYIITGWRYFRLDRLLTAVGTIAGIGGLALGIFLILFREIIRKQIFPALTKNQAYKLIILISLLVWSLSIAGIIAWVINTDKADSKIAKQAYNIDITPYPTSANHEARIRPHSIRLELHCGENTQTLVTLNYPVKKSFIWSPNDCGDVYLYISIDDLVLKKSFLGKYGFPEFLRAFSDGHRIYRPNEFSPDEAKNLKKWNIEFLNVHFKFGGDTQSIMQFITD